MPLRLLGTIGSSVQKVSGAFESIATTTVGSGGTATITFDSIPSTYTHLQLRYTARYSGSVYYDALRIRINSDTGSNYTNHYLLGEGASALANADAPFSSIKYIAYIAGASALSNNFSGGVIDILDYANTSKNKTLRGLWGHENNGTGTTNYDKGFVGIGSGAWLNTNAITRIDIAAYGSGGNFSQYSSFALYGIKGA